MTDKQYLQIAKEYAKEHGNYDIVTFIGVSDGLRVYNYKYEGLHGSNKTGGMRKTGYPHYLEINNEGVVSKVWDTPKIREYRSLHIKLLQNI